MTTTRPTSRIRPTLFAAALAAAATLAPSALADQMASPSPLQTYGFYVVVPAKKGVAQLTLKSAMPCKAAGEQFHLQAVDVHPEWATSGRWNVQVATQSNEAGGAGQMTSVMVNGDGYSGASTRLAHGSPLGKTITARILKPSETTVTILSVYLTGFCAPASTSPAVTTATYN